MTPRESFRANRSLTKGYNDLIYGDQMQAALDAALLEYNLSLAPVSSDVPAAAANRWRVEGAVAFRRTLENLNTTSVASTAPPINQLDHKA
jgi:hypothetical protein